MCSSDLVVFGLWCSIDGAALLHRCFPRINASKYDAKKVSYRVLWRIPDCVGDYMYFKGLNGWHGPKIYSVQGLCHSHFAILIMILHTDIHCVFVFITVFLFANAFPPTFWVHFLSKPAFDDYLETGQWSAAQSFVEYWADPPFSFRNFIGHYCSSLG